MPRPLLALALFLAAAPALADGSPKVDGAIKEVDTRIAELQAEANKGEARPFDRDWVRWKLQHLASIDEYLQRASALPYQLGFTQEERHQFEDQFQTRFDATRSENETELKRLLKRYGWFTIPAFGKKADHDAWLIVSHSSDAAFQKQILKTLAPLAAKKETDPKDFAVLTDQVAETAGDRQVYGTQGHCAGSGKWDVDDISERGEVDDRRASLGLPPLADAIAAASKTCP